MIIWSTYDSDDAEELEVVEEVVEEVEAEDITVEIGVGVLFRK